MDTRPDLQAVAKLKLLRRQQRPPIGKPNRPHCQVLNGIVWRLCIGAPDAICRSCTAMADGAPRFRCWQKVSIWNHILAALQVKADTHGDLA